MLDTLFEIGYKPSATETVLQWKWAYQHPYLFTVIKVSQPYLIAIILLVGSKIISSLFKRGKN